MVTDHVIELISKYNKNHDRLGRFSSGSGGGGGGKITNESSRRSETIVESKSRLTGNVERFKADLDNTPALRAQVKKTHGVTLPPNWTRVQVNINPKGEPRVRGYDAAGRLQPRYSEDHGKSATGRKFTSLKDVNATVKKIDPILRREAPTNGTAAAVLLMRKMGMRPGSDRDTRAEKKAFGATNMEARHAKVSRDGKSVTFDFTGKKGVGIVLKTRDPLIVKTVKAHKQGKKPTDKLFNTNEGKSNAYLKKHLGEGVTQRQLRTVHGTALASSLVAKMPRPTSATAMRRAKLAVAKEVSQALGNTPDVALKSYIDPHVFAGWE